MKNLLAVSLVALTGLASVASAQLTEDFPDPLGTWRSRWLAQNSNLVNYYVAIGNGDENFRGNNPTGLWIHDGLTGLNCDITFNSGFGASLLSIEFGIEAFVGQTVRFYDMAGVEFAAISASGGAFPLDHNTLISSGVSGNGISRILFDGAGQTIKGNTSIDNVRANLIPAPGMAGMVAVGGLLAARRRR
jgi:hypothetical protein